MMRVSGFPPRATVMALLLLVGCESDSAVVAPEPGVMVVRVVTAPAHLGILHVRLDAPVVNAVQPQAGLRAWQRGGVERELQLLVSGPIGVGELVRFQSPDRRLEYTADVLAAAADSFGGYAVLPRESVELSVEAE